MPVPLGVAVLGGEVQVPTLKGKLALKIPPETQNGRVFRLAGQGMPHLGKSTRGDLKAKVNVVLPTKLTEKEKELFRQLNQLHPA
jgi:DnaJ-class molecular chaperone